MTEQTMMYTVGPPNKGYSGDNLYGEVVLFLEVLNVLEL